MVTVSIAICFITFFCKGNVKTVLNSERTSISAYFYDLRRMMYVAPLSSDATIHSPSPACARRDAADRADDIGPHSFASN